VRNRAIRLAVAVFAGVGAGGCASTPAPTPATIFAPPLSPHDPRPAGPQLRGLAFDPRGADFSAWVVDFEKKVHHNWDPPTYFDYGGQVELAFTVERNGTVSALQELASSASEPLKRAAREAVLRSRLGPLPEDYDRLRISMRVTCVYGPPPLE
jgi:TonB family protein